MRRALLDPVRNDRGATIVLVALMLAALLGIAALAIDVGMLYNARAEAQRAADAAALAGAGSLLAVPDDERARSIAIEFGNENRVQGDPVEVLDEDVDVDLVFPGGLQRHLELESPGGRGVEVRVRLVHVLRGLEKAVLVTADHEEGDLDEHRRVESHRR